MSVECGVLVQIPSGFVRFNGGTPGNPSFPIRRWGSTREAGDRALVHCETIERFVEVPYRPFGPLPRCDGEARIGGEAPGVGQQ